MIYHSEKENTMPTWLLVIIDIFSIVFVVGLVADVMKGRFS